MVANVNNKSFYTERPLEKKVSENSSNSDSKSVICDCIDVSNKYNNDTPSITQRRYIRDYRGKTYNSKTCLRIKNGEKQRSDMFVYLTKSLAEQKSESSINLNEFHRAMLTRTHNSLENNHFGNNLFVLPILLDSLLKKNKAVEKKFCSDVAEFVKEPIKRQEIIYSSVKNFMKDNGFFKKDAKNSLDDFCINYMGTSVYSRIIEEVGNVIELTEAEKQKLKNNPEEVTHYLYDAENKKTDEKIEKLKCQFINAKGSKEKAFKLSLLIDTMESKITLIKPLIGIHDQEPQPSANTGPQGPTPKPVKSPDSGGPHHYPSVINNNNNNNVIDLAPVMDLVRDLIKKSNSDSNDTSVKKTPTDIHLTDLITGLKNAKSQIALLNSKVASWQTETIPRSPREVINTGVPAMPAAARAATVMTAESGAVSVPAAQQGVIGTEVPAKPTAARADIIMPPEDEMDGSLIESSGYGSDFSASTEELSTTTESFEDNQSRLSEVVEEQINRKSNNSVGAELNPLVSAQTKSNSTPVVTGLNPPVARLNKHGSYYLGTTPRSSDFVSPLPAGPSPVTLTRGAQVPNLAGKQRYQAGDELSKTTVTGLNPPVTPLNRQGSYYVGAGLDNSAFPQPKPKEKSPVTLTRGAQVRDLAAKYDYQLSDKRFGQHKK